jgi:hypothetical protein
VPGIGITSDQKTLLVNSGKNSAVYAYSLPDLKLLGGASLSGKGANWLTINPDDKTVYPPAAPIDGCAWAWCRGACRCSAFSTYWGNREHGTGRRIVG